MPSGQPPKVGRRRARRRTTPSSPPLLQGTSAVPTRPTTLLRRTGVGLLVLTAVLLPAAPAAAAPETVSPGAAIEALSPYQGQTACEPIARPGVERFRDLVLAAYPGTTNAGIVRACSSGGTSEHKEGRAWDWRADADDPIQAAQVADLMQWLLAPDEHGNSAAMARRLGVMYVIWDAQVWKSYQAARGWQPYSGSSPHTDHVHLSFSWAGALGETSYWTGKVAPVMSRPAPAPAPVVADAAVVAVPPTPAEVARRRALVANLPGPWRRH